MDDQKSRLSTNTHDGDHEVYFYKAYGLVLKSSFQLKEVNELRAATNQMSPEFDIEIIDGEVPDHLPNRAVPPAWVDVHDNQCLLRFGRLGRFLVSGGRRIIVDKDPSASMDDMRGFLLGSALAAATHQRKVVPLHVSSVLTPHGAIAFTGESGAGKSTLAAHVNRIKNWPLISDDVAALKLDQLGVKIESGVQSVKLWRDALKSLGRNGRGLRRDLTRFDKFHAIESDRFVVGRHTLSRLVVLRWGEEYKLTELKGRRAFQAAINAVYRPELASMCGNRDAVVAQSLALASRVRVQELVRRQSDSTETGVLQSIGILFDEN